MKFEAGTSCATGTQAMFEMDFCAGGVPYKKIIPVDDCACDQTVKWVNLADGSVTTIEPANAVAGSCSSMPSDMKMCYQNGADVITKVIVAGVTTYYKNQVEQTNPTDIASAEAVVNSATAADVVCCPDCTSSTTILWTDVTSDPAATGNTAGPRFEYNTANGTKWFVDTDGVAKKLDTKLDVNLTPVAFVPTATGNTTNLGQIVIDPAGHLWAIDEEGDAVQLTLDDTVTTLTNTVVGHKIGTYTNEAGTAVDINESITSLTLNAANELEFVDEDGQTTTIAIPAGSVVSFTATTPPTGTGVEGEIRFVTDDGTAAGAVQETWVYDADSGTWLQISGGGNANADMLQFGSASPTTNGQHDGEEYFVTSTGDETGTVLEQWIWDKQSGTWVMRPQGATVPTTTSIVAQYGNGSAYVNAQANAQATVADVLKLSDGTLVNSVDKITWTGHGLPIHTWFFLDAATAGGYTATPPAAPNLVQRLFYTEDANTIKVQIQEAIATDASATTAAQLRYSINSTTTTANVAKPLTGLTMVHNNVSGQWDAATGTFTASTSGYYQVSGALIASSTWAVNNYIRLDVYKNGAANTVWFTAAQAAGTYNLTVGGAAEIYLAAGDTLKFQLLSTNAVTTNPLAAANYISIAQL